MSVRPATDAREAAWLRDQRVDWWDLVRFGPPGFPVYVRVSFAPDRGTEASPAADAREYDAVQAAFDVLAGHTASTHGYAAIWEGWGGRGPVPHAPRLDIPNRAMLLFTGPLAALRFAPARGWAEAPPFTLVPPHLAWPADRAWCLACEVDEEIAFSVGCSYDAARALADTLPVAVRRVAYGAPEQLYVNDT